MLPFILALITLPLSWAGTALVIRLAHRRGYLAAVNARSSHRRPTPQGAGWAVMGATLPVWCYAGPGPATRMACCWSARAPWPWASWHGGRTSATAASASAWRSRPWSPSIAVLTVPTDNAIIYHGLPWALDRCLAVVGLVYFINLFNFIDGIDGLAGVGAVGIGIGAAAVAALGCLATRALVRARRCRRRPGVPDLELVSGADFPG